MRDSRDNRRLFRGSERTRLAAMVLMLVMLLVMITTIRNRPGMFSWLAPAPDEGKALTTAPPEKQAGASGDEQDLPPALKSALTPDSAKSPPSKSDPAKSDAAKSAVEAKTTEPSEKAKSVPAKSESAKSPSPPSEKTAEPPAAKTTTTTPPKSLADAPPEVLPPADSEEFELGRLKDFLSIVSDKTIDIHPREVPAQFLMLKMANSKKVEELQEKARRDPRFGEFYQRPAEHRGELVQFEMNVRLINKFEVKGDNAAGVKQLYELWGPSDESGAWLYVVNVSELPPGMPSQGEVAERVTVVGRFFKLLAYHERGAGPKARPLAAPVVVGKIVWQPVQRRVAQQDPPWLWAALGGFGVVIVAVLMVSVYRSRKPRRTDKPVQDQARIGDWLHAGASDGGAASSSSGASSSGASSFAPNVDRSTDASSGDGGK